MAGHHRHGSVRSKKVKSKDFPLTFLDAEADFASIKIAPGIEARSYLKDGFVFCEDAKGKIIEIQILNLSALAKAKSNSAA
jgi:hypothetical protein